MSTSTIILEHIAERDVLNDMNFHNQARATNLEETKHEIVRLKKMKEVQQEDMKQRYKELMKRIKEIEELKLRQDVSEGESYFDKIKADVRKHKRELDDLKNVYQMNIKKYRKLLHLEDLP